MVMPETLADLNSLIMTSVTDALKSFYPPSEVQCTAENPHSNGELTFQRGPNLYHCRCGKRYRKDGHGGLQEV